jgi:hypothetical protein
MRRVSVERLADSTAQPGSSSRPSARVFAPPLGAGSRVCAPRFRTVGPRNTAVSPTAAKMMTIPRRAIGTEATCPVWPRSDAGRFERHLQLRCDWVLARSRPVSAALSNTARPRCRRQR